MPPHRYHVTRIISGIITCEASSPHKQRMVHDKRAVSPHWKNETIRMQAKMSEKNRTEVASAKDGNSSNSSSCQNSAQLVQVGRLMLLGQAAIAAGSEMRLSVCFHACRCVHLEMHTQLYSMEFRFSVVLFRRSFVAWSYLNPACLQELIRINWCSSCDVQITERPTS